MIPTCADGGELSRWRICLEVCVASPAGDGVVGSQPAGVILADIDANKLVDRCVGLAVPVCAPAGDGVVGP